MKLPNTKKGAVFLLTSTGIPESVLLQESRVMGSSHGKYPVSAMIQSNVKESQMIK